VGEVRKWARSLLVDLIQTLGWECRPRVELMPRPGRTAKAKASMRG
jgi:hypothetical protein